MDLKQFFLVLRRRWLSILAVLVVAVGVGLGVSLMITPKYQSSSKVFLSVDVRDTTDAYAALLFLSNRAESYANLAQSEELSERVIERLNLEMTPEQLAGQVHAEVIEETALISITVTHSDAREAQTITDVLTEAFTGYIAELETPGNGGSSQLTARVTDQASYNAQPVQPRTVLNTVVAGLIGLLLGIALAVARELLDRTVRTAAHVSEVTDAPVLASIGFDGDIRKSPVLTDLGTFAARTEAFRLLRTNLQFIDLERKPRIMVITSAVPGEGKTMTATNLAVALAQTGRKTLIIDADLRRPRVASTLGLDPAVGLTTALVGRTEIHDAIQVHEPSGLHVLASGAKPPNPTEILQSRVTQDLIRRLRSSYDMVIIDAPPLLPVADASVLAALADGMILVVRHGRTTRDQVEEAAGRIDRVGGKLSGVVVNMVAKRAVGSYYYYYYEETAPQGGSKAAPKAAPRAERKAAKRAAKAAARDAEESAEKVSEA